MRSINKKGDAATNEFPLIVLAVVLLVLGVTSFLLLKTELKDTSATMCWLTNNIKSGGAAFSYFPSMCSSNIIPVEDKMTKVEFSQLIRKTWWMYLQGEEDFGNARDEVFPVYSFTPSEDIKLDDYFDFIKTHNSDSPDSPVKDISKSDYAYLEANTKGSTLCFDKSGKENSIDRYYLAKGQPYYIMFFDDQLPHELNDMILISPNPDYDAGQWKASIGEYFLWVPSTVITAGLKLTGYESLPFYISNKVKDSSCLGYPGVFYSNSEAQV